LKPGNETPQVPKLVPHDAVFHPTGNISREAIDKPFRSIDTPILLQVSENPIEGPQDAERSSQGCKLVPVNSDAAQEKDQVEPVTHEINVGKSMDSQMD